MPPGENQEFANDAAAYFWYVALGFAQKDPVETKVTNLK
jgi:hypothetical protein